MPSVRITKLVAGGQGMGELPDGRKIFVWGVLPGETVEVEITREKKSFAEGVVLSITTPSPNRVKPRDATYLAHSPWQIMTMAAENQAKLEIVREQFTREHIEIEITDFPASIVAVDDDGYGYRNKMEYVFAEQDGELTLALTERGSHDEVPVTESALALPIINTAAREFLGLLRGLGVVKNDVRALVLRASQSGEVVGALYINHPRFKKLELTPSLKGLRVYYHNPRNRTRRGAKLVQDLGENVLTDVLLGREFSYDVHSFFQVNVPVYESVLMQIRQYVDGPVTDMYAGVGSIGLSVAKEHVTLVELDPASASLARRNAKGVDAEVVESSTERALEYINGEGTVIFDPPRAGLSPKVIEQCLAVQPPQIIYLSCDPATLARDLARLGKAYDIVNVSVYNFFPRTPHIETLTVLRLQGLSS